jgi:hypothetical protein
VEQAFRPAAKLWKISALAAEAILFGLQILVLKFKIQVLSG